ncbi:KorB domain-containing protein, partial [Citrobacter freundii]
MTVRDRAEFIGDYMDMAKAEGENITQADVAKQLGFKNTSIVSRLLKLRGMSPEIEALCQTRKTEDVETLATLVDIQKDNPELFLELIELPEIDRGTVRRAKKEGRLQPVEQTTPSNQPETKDGEANGTHQSGKTEDFAHAQ